MPSDFLKECKKYFDETNLYRIFGLDTENAKSYSEKDIKRAYYKASLKYHPDRAKTDSDTSSNNHVESATKRFQILGKAYSVLSDKDKRGLYDESGIIAEDDALGGDGSADWAAYWRLIFKNVTVEDIEKYKNSYKGTEEEIEDLRNVYTRFEGDMGRIYEHAFFVDTEEDRDRVREILQDQIDKNELQHFPKFDRKETVLQKKRRLRKAEKEAAEAEEMLQKITGKKQLSGEEELSKMIAQRGAARAQSFIDQLEEKYGGSETKKRKQQPAQSSKKKAGKK